MIYNFKEFESQKIIEHFGDAFFDKVQNDIEFYSNKWGIEILELVDYFSVNCIFKCSSKKFGDSILKINRPCREVFTEYNTLREYNGKRFCNVFDSDIENGVILEECIKPGIRLRDEQSLEKRLNVFSNLFNGLHIEPENPSMYPTYIEWVSRITKYMSGRDDYKELYLYMKKAENICLQISQSYNRKMLLHGDFHHDNILLNDDGEYKIIDPKGVVGDPIFDVPRYILNESEEGISSEKYYEKICTIINSLETSLSIPKKIIKQCYFIEMSMANCWDVEDNAKPDIQSVIMAENIMKSS
ncbi:aminoglycoside phosphotransferase family protein [Alkaliphilus peptidifermentans]|uniref:Aminoglycoside/hydroxyurea antibiotic resistance kinase n=1 Tax=Alkaliphilus peptidifermentans DSM 18978 TaxID=1120976 RepID=A0A1G5L6S9_9FIRM|nr:aminoglycoside phosphotransferase family protein [Alkaliphilus peptidifermentans]SCZ08516.1 Aminoglycoside/hydroxyurea antibiotic resistance kinase [Alkaliphilus peptidifermentans DSM 18978]